MQTRTLAVVLQTILAALAAAGFFFADVYGIDLGQETSFALGALLGWQVATPGKMAARLRGSAGVLILAFLAGCASSIKPFETASKGLAAAGVAAEIAVDGAIEAREIRMDQCHQRLPNDATADDRRECLGKLAPDLAPLAKETSEAYDEAVRALEALQSVWVEAQQLKEAAN